MDPIRADKPYQTIATNDIGAFVAFAFDRPKEFIGLELEIAGSELTNPEAAQVFSRVLGKRVKFQKLPMLMVRLILGKEIYQMFRWFNQAGFKADIAGLRRRYPEVQHSLWSIPASGHHGGLFSWQRWDEADGSRWQGWQAMVTADKIS